MFARELIHEIDETLRRLEQNALNPEDFSNTQDNLLAHLLYLDKVLAEKPKQLTRQNSRSARYQIEEKLSQLKMFDQDEELEPIYPPEPVNKVKASIRLKRS